MGKQARSRAGAACGGAARGRAAPREVEAKLAVVSRDPEGVCVRIQTLPGIAGFELLPLAPRSMRDVYVDLRGDPLGKRRLALRIRTVGESVWITLKGRGKGSREPFLERIEIEDAWSEAGVRHILRELASRGVDPPPLDRAASAACPLACLEALGFHPIQERSTERIARDVRRRSRRTARASLAELALDTVAFRTGRRTIRHHEIELELRAGTSPDALAPLLQGLERTFGDALRPWPHDKLATGLALAHLIEQGTLTPPATDPGRLGPPAYDTIDRCLRAAGASAASPGREPPPRA